MPVDAEVKKLLEQRERAEPRPRSSWTISETRQKYVEMRVLAGQPKELRRVEDATIAGQGGDISIRLYAAEVGRNLPAVVYLHGGRFISGNLETHDRVCRDLAARSGCVIIAVDYRLAPENPFPAAVEDAFSAAVWAASEGSAAGIDAYRIGVAGDSAGGNLAAATALLAWDKKNPLLSCQLLIYPMLDATCGEETHRTLADGYGAGSEDMQQGYREYVPREVDLQNPVLSPLFARELTGLPPTFVLTAEYDCLRDEGELYAKRLKEAGVTVVSKRYDGMIHGFFQMAGVLSRGVEAIEDASAFLRENLAVR